MSATPRYIVTPVARDMIRALDEGDELIAVYGGMRSGKTWAIALACLVLCQTRKELNPKTGAITPLEIMITRRTQKEIKRSFWNPFQAVIAPAGGRFISEQGAHRWIMPNGSVIHWSPYKLYGTQGESESSLEGLGASVIFGDEATQYPDEFFNHTLERTSQPSINIATGRKYMSSQVVWLSRPASDTRFLDIAKERHRNGLSGRVIISATRDCQTPEYLDKLRKSHPKSIFDAITQDVPGSTVPTTGAIYSDWSNEAWPSGNVLDIEIDKTYPTILAIDPSVNHTACLWIQHHTIDGQPVAVVVDEWNPPPPCRAQDIVREAHRRGWALSECIIDPAANARTQTAVSTTVHVLRRPADSDHPEGPGLGCPVRAKLPPARSGVKDGIYKLMTRICDAAGCRTLTALRRIIEKPETPGIGLRHTLDNYAWDKVTGEPLKGAKGKEADHIADALRYWCVFYGWNGPPGQSQATSASHAAASMFGRR